MTSETPPHPVKFDPKFNSGDRVRVPELFKDRPTATVIDSAPYMSVHPFTLDVKVHYGKCRILIDGIDTTMICPEDGLELVEE